MAEETENPVVTSEWGLLVASGLEFSLSLNGPDAIRVAIAASLPAATFAGRLLASNSAGTAVGITRAFTGPGNLYARTDGGEVAVALDTWT